MLSLPTFQTMSKSNPSLTDYDQTGIVRQREIHRRIEPVYSLNEMETLARSCIVTKIAGHPASMIDRTYLHAARDS